MTITKVTHADGSESVTIEVKPNGYFGGTHRETISMTEWSRCLANPIERKDDIGAAS